MSPSNGARPVSVVGTKEWREHVPSALQEPLGKALHAMDTNDLPQAMYWFGVCFQLVPDEPRLENGAMRLVPGSGAKPILYFGSQVAAQAYFTRRGREHVPQAELDEWYQLTRSLMEGAVEVSPQDPVPMHNLGRFFDDCFETDKAIACYRRALSMNAELVESWGNLGTALYNEGRTTEAWDAWNQCLRLTPALPSGWLAQSYISLRKGDYIRGWSAFQHRWRDLVFKRDYGRSEQLGGIHWHGEPLPPTHRLLIHGEQGLGDHVQFARYLPLLQAQGYNVVGLETRAVLKRWMEAAFPDIPIFARDVDTLPPLTHHASSMDLPFLFATTLETVPPVIAPRDRPSRGLPVPAGTRPVGLAWAGAKGNPADHLRSIPTEALGVLADIPGVTWVGLLFHPDAPMIGRAWLGERFVDGTAGCRDTLDTAAVMDSLEHIYTVDTLTAHLAGTLGRPTTVLHRFCPEWRWTTDLGSRSPWYPTITNRVVPAPGAWRDLLEQIRCELSSSTSA